MIKRLNRETRKNKLIGDLHIFLNQYGRKAQKGIEPNDRTYDRKFERKMKKMDPQDLGKLMQADDED